MFSTRPCLLVLVIVAVATGCGEPENQSIARPLDTPAAPGSGQPDLTVGADGRLYLTWIDPTTAGHALRFAVWEDDAWSRPRTVAEGDRWFVNWADIPSLAALADGSLAAHWLAKSGDSTYAYDVWLAVSRDGGTNWSPPVRAHDDGTQTEHGFVSLVPNESGFDVIWLDGRRMAADPPGPMTLRQARLDVTGGIGPATVLDHQVCDCCPTDAIRTGGDLVVLYRDRSPEEIRDISITRQADGKWSTPSPVWNDGWEIAGCPVNGPAVDGAGSDVVAAWFTVEGTRQGIVKVAFSSEGGSTFAPPVRVDEGDPIGRVDVVRLPDGSARVSWLEQTASGAAILVRDVTADGQLGPARVVTYTSVKRSSGYPKLAFHDDRTFVAWTAVGENENRIETAVLD